MSPSTKPQRSSYHHGDLKNALTRAAEELAASDGPEQITVRAVAKSVGVTPTAAYRHFADRDELLDAVKERAMVELATSIGGRLATIDPDDSSPAAALARLRASGEGYINFAIAEPGLFRTAFSRGGQITEPPDDPHTGYEPYQMLVSIVEGLVRAGLVAESDRAIVESTAWSTVHGLSLLLIDGPLRLLPEPAKHQLITETVDFVCSRFVRPS